MTPDEFAKEIAKDVRSQNYSFLFGNGINHILRRSCFKWDEMLESIGESYQCEKVAGITNTEFAGLIDLKARNPEKKGVEKSNINHLIQQFIIQSFVQSKSVKGKCKILDFAWNNGHHILTTNFDTELEQYIQMVHNGGTELQLNEVQVPAGNEKAKSNQTPSYRWNRYWGTCNALAMPTGGHDIWHIHGRIDTGKSYSLIASMTKYCGAIRKVADMGRFNDEHWGGENTWLEYFIKRPLIIAGLDLGEQEIFPRFLLMRKEQWKEGKVLNHKSYFLVRKKEKEAEEVKDGRNFLKALGFTIVEFDSYDQIYNHPLWENMQATKKAK